MKLLIPLALALAGLAGGLAAGHMLKPPPPAEETAAALGGQPAGGAEGPAAETAGAGGEATDPAQAKAPDKPMQKRDYVELDRQFVVPLVEAQRISGLMIVTLSLEMEEGLGTEVHSREPKLRDRFLRVLFRHAQSGGFDGVFTAGPRMRDLRGALLEAAQGVLGPVVHDVLVTDILRQDM